MAVACQFEQTVFHHRIQHTPPPKYLRLDPTLRPEPRLNSGRVPASALGALSVAATPQAGDSLVTRGEQLEKRLGVLGESPEILEEDDDALLDGDLPQDDLDLSDNYPLDVEDDIPVGNSTEIDYDEVDDETDVEDAEDVDVDDEDEEDEASHGNVTLAARATKAKYKIKERISGDGFYKAFNFNTFADPTHGRVDYVSMKTAKKLKLAVAGKGKFVMRADAKNKVKGNQRGRKSIRITSKKAYKTHVVVLDVRHMPQGTATWPAFWEFGNNWPNQGELDIIEGANDKGPNLSSLHTSPGCTQPRSGRNMKGHAETFDCNAFAAGNVGCGVKTDSNRSFGPNFNKNGGGWFAAERTSKYIKVWFWSRKDKHVPKEVKNGSSAINPNKWGKPTARFVSNSCPINSKFGPNNIVINLTFCGDWAGNTFPGGMGKCLDMVNNNPGAFKNAYWNIARLNVYT